MPYALKGACRAPGCPGIAVRHDYCAEHQHLTPSRQHDGQRASPAQRGYGRAWQGIRMRFLRLYPECTECGAPATDVDHVMPLADGGSNDIGNLQALCHAHHSAKTAREQGGWQHSKGSRGA